MPRRGLQHRHLLILPVLAGFVGFLFGCTSDSSPTNTTGACFEETLRIGSDDPDGTYQRTIGEHGQGPGAFRGVSAMHVDAQGRLLVADPAQSRFTAFSRSGELLDTYSLPGVRRVTDLVPLSGGWYALIGAGKGHLVHVVDSTFSTALARLVPRESVQATDHKLGRVISITSRAVWRC